MTPTATVDARRGPKQRPVGTARPPSRPRAGAGTSPAAFLGTPRTVRAPRGPERVCKTWQAEAAMRMLMNNLDPEVAERPEALVVYGGTGQAARSWPAFEAIV